MDTNTIKYFIKTVNQGSINKAAQLLYMNHQNLGKKLSQMEEELGIKLLKRTKTGIALTEDGKIIYDKLIKIDEITKEIDEYVNFIQKNQDEKRENSKKMIIYLNSSIFPKKASKAILDVEKHFPDTEIHIEESYYIKALEQIYAQENVFANAVVSLDEFQKIPKDIMVFHKQQYDLVGYIPKDLLKDKNTFKSMEITNFLKLPLVFYSAYDVNENLIYKELNKYGEPVFRHITMNYINFCDIMFQKKYATAGWHKTATKYYKGDEFSKFMLDSNEIEITRLMHKNKKISAVSVWLCRRDTKLLEEMKYLVNIL